MFIPIILQVHVYHLLCYENMQVKETFTCIYKVYQSRMGTDSSTDIFFIDYDYYCAPGSARNVSV